MCTTKGCIDLAPDKSISQILGRAGRNHKWLTNWFGIFAAAFPGFVIGYYTSTDVPLSQAGMTYLHVAIWAFGSYLVANLVVRVLNLSATLAATILAGAAAGLYYWFAGPTIATEFSFGRTAVWTIRALGLGLVLIWLGRGVEWSWNWASRR
jgi:hypothetical protein